MSGTYGVCIESVTCHFCWPLEQTEVSDVSVNGVISVMASACLLAFKETVPHLFEKRRDCCSGGRNGGELLPLPTPGWGPACRMAPARCSKCQQQSQPLLSASRLGLQAPSFPFKAVLGRTGDSNRENCAPEREQRKRLIFTMLTLAPSPG